MHNRLENLGERISNRYKQLFGESSEENTDNQAIEFEESSEQEKPTQYFEWEIIPGEPGSASIFAIHTLRFPAVNLKHYRASQSHLDIQKEELNHIPDTKSWREFASQLAELIGFYTFFNLESIRLGGIGAKSDQLLHLLLNFNPVNNKIPEILFKEVKNAPQETLIDLLLRHHVIERAKTTGRIIPAGKDRPVQITELLPSSDAQEEALSKGYTEMTFQREGLKSFIEYMEKNEKPYEIIDHNPEAAVVIIRQPSTKTREELALSKLQSLPPDQLRRLANLSMYKEMMPLIGITAHGIHFAAEYFQKIYHPDAQALLQQMLMK